MGNKRSIPKYAVIFYLPFVISSCNDNAPSNNMLEVSKVKVISAGKNVESASDEYIGTVESSNTVDVSFISTGTIEQLYFKEGQSVRKGQLMAKLNTTTLKSAHTASVSTLKQAQDAYSRMNEMYKNQSLPEIKLIDFKTSLAKAQSAEMIAKKSLDDSYLYAPESGTISKKYFENGMNVVLGAPVYTIMNINTVDVNIPIPEGEISGFERGQYCDVVVTALGQKKFRGQIIIKGVSANPVSHTYNIKVRISNSNTGGLMPGMVVKAYFDNPSQNRKSNDKIIIPLKYILLDYPDKRFVWIADKNNKVQRKEVNLGQLLGNDVEIIGGLQIGDRIITDGYQNINPGSKVTVIN
ncbi:efflux RND transporter periplasmic adaptor subunit [uncultured Chryseobacterium sp.]|uniref:efflux RND transporter periplasmic adaptor subunit n=1 Tax=uncultured Chryseobacterium sp. TaxID=259322 RepID=UPI0025EABC05|nr:efflux RND transporter periplasmic adaptor subunit [uncultured Chryseobacterium sp.]